MEKPKKRRLVFDLTEEEYNKFVEKAKARKMTNIELLRTTWLSSAFSPPALEERTGSVMGLVRNTYIGLIYSCIATLNSFNNSITEDNICPSLLDNPWHIFISQIKDLTGLLEKVPPSLEEKDFKPLERPKWLAVDVYKLVISRLAKNRISEKEE